MKTLLKKCDAVWTLIIKERAGFKSELSGAEGKVIGGSVALASHHIAGKANYRLRFELDNGICLENQREHIFGVHNRNPLTAREWQDKIIAKIGQAEWEYLKRLKSVNSKTDLHLVFLFLKQELLKIQELK